MPIPNDYHQIVSMLIDKTEAGLAHWRQDRFDISVSVGGSKFSIWAGTDEHSEEPFVAFALHDEKGATIDSWYVEENEGPQYHLMHRLYKSAKRRASGVPERLQLLAQKIASSEEIGKEGDT